MAKESNDKIKKENNILISGLTESTSRDKDEIDQFDKDCVSNLLVKIGSDIEKVHRITRLKKINATKPAITLVEFKNKDDQQSAIINSKNLKSDEQYKQIFINKDLTQAEAQLEKELRLERNKLNATLTDGDGRLKYGTTTEGKTYYWGIRWGSVKKIDKSTSRILQ